jgi:hypothetical protein
MIRLHSRNIISKYLSNGKKVSMLMNIYLHFDQNYLGKLFDGSRIVAPWRKTDTKFNNGA